jgi:predicted phage-related endonuclease
MITLELIQGTKEWADVRAKHFTASEAPAMLGLSKYKTRSELIREKATGIVAEVDEATQRRFNAGHEAEEKMREWAENAIEEELYPVTGSLEVDGLHLLASFDGLTMDESIAWENKLWNEDFAEMVRHNQAPDTHWPQLEQQLLVSGANRVLFTVGDGDSIEYMWYTSQPDRRARLIASWKQFAEDVRNYNPASITVEEAVTGRAPDMLPALHIEVTGMVTASNLAQFKSTALTVFRGINTNLQTDQDFADAEKAVKFCKDAEERLDAAKAHALSQTASIDELFRTIDQIKDEAKAVRLKLDKLVKGEKENRKAEIVDQARKALGAHLRDQEDRLGGAWMPRMESFPPAGDVVKGLKTLDSMRDRLSAWLANSKVQANEVADRIERNHKSVEDWTLVPDFGAICQKAPEDFAALINMRKTQRVEAEATERARIRAEEQEKAEREAQAKAKAEQAERDAAVAALAKAITGIPAIQQNQQVADQIDDGKTLKLGEIGSRLGFSVTADFLSQLGFQPHAIDKNAKLYRASDFPRICNALIDHINAAMRSAQMAA